nr:hypothetical protein [Chlamydiota bacterium]
DLQFVSNSHGVVLYFVLQLFELYAISVE